MKNKHLLAVAVAAAVAITACRKNTSEETAVPPGKEQISIYLTDGPGLFDQVLIDIRSVKVLVDTSSDTRRHDNSNWEAWGANDHRNDSSFVWETLNIQPGQYDILKFRNGADTLLSASNITKGAIRLIKIEIGNNNVLVKDSVNYPISWPSGQSAYVLIKLKGNECEQYLPGKKRIWIDFDINRSIIQGINNQFFLRPVFHFFVVSNTASLSGKVTPKDGYPVVTVFNSSDTAYALPDKNGNFKVRGLADGNYSVYVNASNGYKDTTITNVAVKAPGNVSVGTINLHK